MEYKFWTQEDKLKLIQLVNTKKYSFKEIGEILGRSVSSVTSYARNNNISNAAVDQKTYHFNENFWSNPNPVSAYWAGFFAADGNIQKYGKADYCYSFRIELSDLDTEHLKIFKEDCGFNGPITFPIRMDKNKILKTCKICVNGSSIWKNDLETLYGIIPNKTKRLPPPNLNDDYLKWCYLIGLIDGDGSICSCSSNKEIIIKIYGSSNNLLEWAFNFVKSKDFIMLRNRKSKILQVGDTNCKSIAFGGMKAIEIFNYLRNFPVPKLTRKWQNPKILQIITQYKEKYKNTTTNLNISPVQV